MRSAILRAEEWLHRVADRWTRADRATPVAPGMNSELRDKRATHRAGEGKGASNDPHTPAQISTIYGELADAGNAYARPERDARGPDAAEPHPYAVWRTRYQRGAEWVDE